MKENQGKLEQDREKKSKFKEKKDNIVNSLKEVECFLCSWKRASKGVKLYKIIKK